MRVKLPTSWVRTDPSVTARRPWLWVLTGMFAVVGLIGAHTADLSGLLEVRASWWRLLISFPATCVLLLAWWQLGPAWRRPLTTAALWAAPMMFALPMHSRDAYAYAATGWQVAREINPYETPLGDAGQPGLLVGVHWYQTTSVYPSLSLDLFGLVSRLTGGDLYWTLVGLRLPSVLALVLLAWTLPRLARRFGVDETMALWAGLANPIILVQWIGGAHNDALMVALGVTALLAATDVGWRGWRGLILAGVLLGLAMGIKQSAALYGLGVVAVGWGVRFRDGAGWPRLTAVALVPGAVTVATFLLSSLSWGLGWRNPTAGNPIEATSNAPLSWVASFLRYNELLPQPVANSLVSAISTVLIVTAIVLAWIRFGPTGSRIALPWAFALSALTAFIVLGPALQPWYLSLVLPIYVFLRAEAGLNRIWLLGVVGFALLAPLQDLLAPYISMLILLFPLWGLWALMRRSGLDPLPASDAVGDAFETTV